ncbi:MAG: RNA polymerase sigma factor [Pseudomonadota bacterium]
MGNFADSLHREGVLQGYIAGLCGERSAADDVLQTVAEKFLRTTPEADQLRHYLFRAGRNAAIDQQREEERRRRREADYAAATAVEPRDAEETAGDRQVLELVQRALDELPLLTRQVFLQFHVLGYAQKEIAAAHGLHLSTIEKRLGKARRHCLERLDEWLGPATD